MLDAQGAKLRKRHSSKYTLISIFIIVIIIVPPVDIDGISESINRSLYNLWK